MADISSALKGAIGGELGKLVDRAIDMQKDIINRDSNLYPKITDLDVVLTALYDLLAQRQPHIIHWTDSDIMYWQRLVEEMNEMFPTFSR